MSSDLEAIARQLLSGAMGLAQGEELLVVSDRPTRVIGRALAAAGRRLGAETVYLEFSPRSGHGEEPPVTAAAAMSRADVVICPTLFSLTHTQARRQATDAGARVATLPAITEAVMRGGALQADAGKVARRSRQLARLLSEAHQAVLVTGDDRLTIPLTGRVALADTGLYHNPGEMGNLPAGEAFIPPVEGQAEGTCCIDGSMAGLGRLETPLRATIHEGRLQQLSGKGASQVLAALDRSPDGRNLAELGVGTNDGARLTGHVLEDEKVLGTAHIAFGDNSTFGGSVAAGVHLDGVMTAPTLYLDDVMIVSEGGLVGPAAAAAREKRGDGAGV